MTQEEKKYVEATIRNEGFDYAIEHYSDFKDEVKDEAFHRLRESFLNEKAKLKMYIENGIDVDEFLTSK